MNETGSGHGAGGGPGGALQSGYRGGYLIGFVIIAVVAARIALLYRSSLLAPALLLAAYSVLYGLEPRLSRRSDRFTPFYFLLQAGVTTALTNLRPFADISSMLYIPLCMQAIRAVPWGTPGLVRASLIAWPAVFGALMFVTLMSGMEPAEGLALYLQLLAALAFLVSYDYLYTSMQAGRAESERLLAELQAAHRKLQEYAGQAEELAAARERNRLARELHDSVSQAIFSIRLTAASARMLLERDPGRVPGEVDRLQAMTGEALARLRSLIAELRPPREA